MRSRIRIAFAVIAVVLTTAIAGGCGLGAGKGTSNVSLTITRAFGTQPIGSITRKNVPGSETVMRMLERSFKVTTRYGGGFVQSIDGISGSASRRDWFYYVNGIQAKIGAANTAVHRGDRIWWDLHDWSATDSVPAVVGSFPEPFVHGSKGRRLPTTLECAPDVPDACKQVASELKAVGVPVATQFLGTGSGTDSLAVLVGTWPELQGTFAGILIAHGPTASGVYARFNGAGGHSLQLLDPHGRVARTVGAGAGLVAATAQGSSSPTWLVTGTDPAGVSVAAAALTPKRLADHFALAVQGNGDLPVPLQGAQ
ncbi:MAG: DUF4430 domain-containing protein [Solirubrobacteraceae bacterium]